MDAQTLNTLSNSGIWSIIEFASISGIVIVTYLAMHAMFRTMKAPTKMLLAMFMGTLAYGLGKVFLVTLLIKPMLF